MTLYYAEQPAKSTPVFYDQPESQIPSTLLNKRIIMPSKMFLIKEELKTFAAQNPDTPIYNASQGDGGLTLGGIPPRELADALIRYLPEEGSTKYGDPTGRADVREAILRNYYRLESLTTDNIILGDGGRDLLQKWYQLIQQSSGQTGGSIVVSAAPWGSYMQGTYINCLNTILAPSSSDVGFQLTREGIDASVQLGRESGKPVVALVITTPDNPTGNYLEMDAIQDLVQHAVACGIEFVLLDFMYQSVTDPDVDLYDVNGLFGSLTPEERNAVFILDGLTKSVGGSNLRNCHLVFGNSDHMQKLKGLATHSVLPNALGEAAALEVYGKENPTDHPWVKRVVEPTARSRAIVREELTERGFKFIVGQGYYTFINIWPWLNRDIPEAYQFVDTISGEHIGRIDNVKQLKSYLAQKWGLAIIPGAFFHQPHFIRFSYANDPDYTRNAIQRLDEALASLVD